MGELFSEINANAAAAQEADDIIARAEIQCEMDRLSSRERRYCRAKDAAFKRYTMTIASYAALAGTILASVIIAIAALVAGI